MTTTSLCDYFFYFYIKIIDNYSIKYKGKYPHNPFILSQALKNRNCEFTKKKIRLYSEISEQIKSKLEILLLTLKFVTL